MPLDIKLDKYELDSVLEKDNFLIHYKANDLSGDSYIITEFCPAYMVKRTDEGTLETAPRFVTEFSISLEKFLTMARGMANLNAVCVSAVDEVLEQNNTAYMVRRVCEFPTLSTYMGESKMDYTEAYEFIRPLLLILAQLEKESGISFKFSDQDLRVNRNGQLIMDCVFAWDNSFYTTVGDIMRLYFQLITGQSFNPSAPAISNYGITLPIRLEGMLLEILSGDVLYGSMDDFFKKFKFIMDLEGRKGRGGDAGGDGSVAKMAAGILACLLVVSIIVLVFFGIVPAYQLANPDLADPSLFRATPTVRPAGERNYNFSSLAFTNPQDDSDILDGTFYYTSGTMYYRAYQNGYCLAKRGTDGNETILAQNVRPAFITVYDGFVYFTDGLAGHKICRVGTEGGPAEILSDNCALYIAVQGDYLFYTNHDDRDRLYRLNVKTREDGLYIRDSAYNMIADKSALYFLNRSQMFTVYSMQLNREDAEPLPLNETESGNLQMHKGLLFYGTPDGIIRRMTKEGQPVELDCPVKAYAFFAYNEWLVIIEKDTYLIKAYNMDTGEKVSLTNHSRSAYVWVQGGTVYSLDYENSRTTRRYNLP